MTDESSKDLRRIEGKIDCLIEAHNQLHESHNRLYKLLEKIMATLADIGPALTALKTVEDGVVALLTTLSTQLAAALAANDPAQIQTVIDTINTQKATLAAAISANTPAGPPTP